MTTFQFSSCVLLLVLNLVLVDIMVLMTLMDLMVLVDLIDLIDLMVLVDLMVLMALMDPGPLSSSVLVFQDINKRLSLPADIRLPDGYLEKFNVIGPSLFEQPISRRLHRVSLVCPSVSVGLCLVGHLLPVIL